MVTDTVAPAVAFETVIGLEIHAQLITNSKMFCGCSAAAFAGEPNANVCPICMGMPGVLPVINREAVRQAVRVALALHGNVQRESKFDRKNYTYPDLPKGYQISQYDLPVSRGGFVNVLTDAGERRVGITRVHMEEDTGRSLHRMHADGSGYSLVDLNRAGVPLLEIVSEPDMRSPEEAREYLVTLRDILRYIGASTGNMEEGALRCDANISLRPHGSSTFGAKVEIKNVNSFRGVYHAIQYEVQRQASVLRADGTLIQETRGWSEERGVTLPQRTKEYADDYRYFPEPDLPTLVLSDAFIAEARASLPELPDARRHRYMTDFGLSVSDAAALSASRELGDYFEAIVGDPSDPKRIALAAALIMNDWRTLTNERGIRLADAPSPAAVRGLMDLIEGGAISRSTAKEVFTAMVETHESATTIVDARGLAQQSDAGAIMALIERAIEDNPKMVADYRKNPNALNALVGQVMKMSRGTANNQVVRELLIQRLAAPE
ncbi:MAG: Asp-tRNA(Asn)/Glu-tRNA(Gln) amidotransferase subunit GatB [Chloroflexota bacterium]|nr:Asp-tRNA(Asn)/Glu-tRNA(Gln) amidotransferase subunit GatB [Chloroflexota bacterium]